MQTVSASEIDQMRRCPYAWQLSYKERWSYPSSGATSLDKGTCYHAIMEVHFKALMQTQDDPDATDEDRLLVCVQSAQEALDNMRETNAYPPETLDLVAWMYQGYIEMYGIDKGWRILAVETTHIVPFFEPDGNGGWKEAEDFNLKIKIDLAATDERDRLIIIDHKSAARIPKMEKDFIFADQFGLYEYGYRQLGYRVFGTLHNANTTKQNKGDVVFPGDAGYKTTMKAQDLSDRMHRTYMTRTDQELRTIQYEALKTTRKRYADPDPERYPDPDKCRWCAFEEACLTGRRNGDEATRIYLQDVGFTQNFGRH